MDFVDAADNLAPAQLRSFVTSSTLRVAASLELGPQATQYLDGALDDITADGVATVTFDEFHAADHRDNPYRPANTGRFSVMGSLISLLSSANLSSVAVLAQGLDVADEHLWTTYATLTGVPDEHLELWASLAPDWDGSPTELTAGIAAATS